MLKKAQSKRRFFLLTSQKQLHYFESDECRVLKGTVDLKTMKDRCTAMQKNSEKFEIPCAARKWTFTCATSSESIEWCNRVRDDPKAVVNRIIAAQIQGQPQQEKRGRRREKGVGTSSERSERAV